MLIKLGKKDYAFPQQLHLRHKWLIPTTGGDRINKLLKILPALSKLDPIPPKLQLCQISPPETKPDNRDFEQALNLLTKRLNCSIIPLRISAYSVSEIIIKLTKSKKYGLIVLGASKEGLLRNAVKGNIPEAIARKANTTVIIFRSFD